MNRQTIKDWCQIVALAAVVILCAASTYGVVKFDKEIASAGPTMNAAVASRVDKETAFVNAQVVTTTTAANQALIELRKTIFTANVSAMETGKAAQKEGLLLDQLNPKILASVDGVNSVTGQLKNTLVDLSDDSKQVTNASVIAIGGINPILANLNTTVTDLNATVADPNIKVILAQTAGTMTELHNTAINVTQTSDYTKEYIRQLTHPTAIQKAVTYTVTGLGVAAKFFIP